jgi:hypothetical protein
MSALVALAAALATFAGEQDLRSELARLESPSASDRGDAERWLASHLSPDDFALVAEVAKARGLETRTRLARALGADDRHFELAVLFFGDSTPEVSAIGTEALASLAVRWFGDTESVPWVDAKVESELSGHLPGVYAVRLFDEDVESELDRLARFAPEVNTSRVRGEHLSIALDPLVYTELVSGRIPPVPGSSVPRWAEGAFESVLVETIARHRLGFEGLGFAGPHPWIRVARPSELGARSALGLLLDWCRDVIAYPDRPRGEGSARALASTGWPAPLAWLESRWRKLGDRNALSGVLLAAGRGAMVPSLARANAVEALLAEVASANVRDGNGERRRATALHALEKLPRFAPDGGDLVERVLAGSGGRPNAPSVTASILAGIGSAPERYRDEVRARLQQATLEAGENSSRCCACWPRPRRARPRRGRRRFRPSSSRA